jgi:L-fucose isomerase-like protein
MARIGVLALARATFDVPFAEEIAAKAFAALDRTGHTPVGTRALLFDAAAAESAMEALKGEALDVLLLMQVTFTDASMTVRIAESAAAPLAIWAFPEPRTGGRLRLNSFCGLNLAAHALGRAGKRYRWLYAAPVAAEIDGGLNELVAGQERKAAELPTAPAPSDADRAAAERVLSQLAGRRIGLVGEHPAGFDTCRYDDEELAKLAGVQVARIALPTLFERARAVPADAVAATRRSVGEALAGLDGVDQPQLEKSLTIFRALEGLAKDERYAAMAVRCWPEMFTDYGCAACGPMGLMNEARVPCACEADMYGALTALALQEIAGEPSFLADIVDMDAATDTSVLWHCGLAPMSMADRATPPAAQIHSNRRMPLLQEFALKPGRVTAARFSQAKNETKLVVAGGEMISAPKSFSGTSGVIRFDRPAGEVAASMMEMALEHHVAIVYGDVRGPLRALGHAMGLQVIELA